MPKMFHDMEEDVVRRRIEKARDERSNPKHRLENALELVELVARMLKSDSQGGAEGPATQPERQPAVTPEEFEPAVDGEGNPIHADDLQKKEGKPGFIKKILG